MKKPQLAKHKCRTCGGAGYVTGNIADEEWILAHLRSHPGRYLYLAQNGQWLASYPEPERAVFNRGTIEAMRTKGILKELFPGNSSALALTSHPNTTTPST